MSLSRAAQAASLDALRPEISLSSPPRAYVLYFFKCKAQFCARTDK